MCHEAWRRARRAQREEEPQDLWRDFERIWPADAPEIVAERSEDEVDTEPQEPVTVKR